MKFENSLPGPRRDGGYEKERLPHFRRIQAHKRSLIWLALRYAFDDRSIVVVTEGLGPQKFHGRIVLLVNEHTAGQAEMVAAFAEENQLATIVGTKTAGRLLTGMGFKAGHRSSLGLPIASNLTCHATLINVAQLSPTLPLD